MAKELNPHRVVQEMAAVGMPEGDIARVLCMSITALRDRYALELDTGAVRANTKVAQALFRKAMGNGPGAVTAAIFWLKCRSQWVEPIAQQVTPGKKQLAQQVAESAVSGTDWRDDLAIGGGEARIN